MTSIPPKKFKRIHVELTNVCDFNCLFCPKSRMTRKPGFMDRELAMDLIDQIHDQDLAEKITLHVMGEPTLHPAFFDILQHAESVGVKVGLTTNGGGLGGPIGQRLPDFPLHQIDVSLQTPDPESFRLRKAGRLDFDRYFQGMIHFFAEYRQKNPDTVFKFRFLNTRFPPKSIERSQGPIRVLSSNRELRDVFGQWIRQIYGAVGDDAPPLEPALARLENLVTHKWNVVEILPEVFFETYVLADWGHAFEDGRVIEAWAGYCDGLREHFAILYNGDVTLCCVDFDGRTAVGNAKRRTLAQILDSSAVKAIGQGFERYRPVHPYCKRCLGGKNPLSWMLRPAVTILGMDLLKPYFYHQTRLFDAP